MCYICRWNFNPCLTSFHSWMEFSLMDVIIIHGWNFHSWMEFSSSCFWMNTLFITFSNKILDTKNDGWILHPWMNIPSVDGVYLYKDGNFLPMDGKSLSMDEIFVIEEKKIGHGWNNGWKVTAHITLWPYLTFIVGTDHLCWLSGSSTDWLVLFGYTQLALNADAMFEFHPHDWDKGLLSIILLWSVQLKHHIYKLNFL